MKWKSCPCLQNKWFITTGLTGLSFAALPCLLSLLVSAPAFVCLLCHSDHESSVGLFLVVCLLVCLFNIFQGFPESPSQAQGWNQQAGGRGLWVILYHHLCQTYCRLKPQPKHGLKKPAKINVENREREVT